MIWIFLGLLAALLSASALYFKKKLSPKMNRYILAVCFTLPIGILFLILLLFEGMPVINLKAIIALGISVIIGMITTLLLITVFRKIDLSLAIPMIAFTPLFMIISSPFILGEFPSLFGFIGILLIVVGAYVLNIEKKKHGLLEPFKHIFKNKGIFYMLIIAFLYSIVANFSKLAIINSSTNFYFAFFYIIAGIIFLIICLVKTEPKFREILHYKRDLFAIIIFTFFMGILMGYILHFTLASYAIALKRVNILFASILGFIFLKENDIKVRLITAGIMVAGTVLIALS